MKKHIVKVIIVLVVIVFGFHIKTYAQLPDAGTEVLSFRLSGLDSYFNHYFEPFAKATAVSMGGGWYNTAKTHKFLGFDITLLGFSTAMIPDEAKLFAADNIDWGEGLSLNSTTSDIPTIASDKVGTRPILEQSYTIPGTTITGTEELFELIDGANVPAGFSLNMFQVGIGLPKGTDLKIRYLPTFSVSAIDLTDVSLWGIGVQHDIKQWIPVISKVPILQISASFAYSKFTADFTLPFSITHETFNARLSNLNQDVWDNQTLGIDISSTTGNIIVGAKIPVFQPYISAGFNRYSFDGGLKGSYPVIRLVTTTDIGQPVEYIVDETDEDPITVDPKGTMMNFAAGFRLKLAIITIFGQYTLQEYPMATAGLGISFR